MIRYVQANNSGNFSNDDGWITFPFQGRSVFILRVYLSHQLGHGLHFLNITLCTRAGRYGRLTPLTVDLHRNLLPMDIIVLNTGTPRENFAVSPIPLRSALVICFYSWKKCSVLDAKTGPKTIYVL
jgi:hypothetical protein